MKTWDYFERVRALNANCSDYRLAKILDINPQAVANYRAGRREADDAICAKVAALLDLPPLKVIADVRAARAEAENQPAMVEVWNGAAQLAMERAALMVGRDRFELSTNWLKANRSPRRRRRDPHPEWRRLVEPHIFATAAAA